MVGEQDEVWEQTGPPLGAGPSAFAPRVRNEFWPDLHSLLSPPLYFPQGLSLTPKRFLIHRCVSFFLIFVPRLLVPERLLRIPRRVAPPRPLSSFFATKLCCAPPVGC